MEFLKSGYYLLSTGRKIYANCGIIGLRPGEIMEICEGYDGTVVTEENNGIYNHPPMTDGERAEIADTMIEAWQKYRAAIPEATDGATET